MNEAPKLLNIVDIKYPIKLWTEILAEKWPNTNEIVPFFKHLLSDPDPLVEPYDEDSYDVNITIHNPEDLKLFCHWLWPKEFDHAKACFDEDGLWIYLCSDDGSHIAEMNCI